ncbi:hypothetical protein UlMin_037209 [Ulmus minor]
MQDFSKACLEKNMEFEVNGVKNFGQSLQKLRSLRSQLHHGANYCEASFMNAKEKKVVVDNTKEYICKAIITVVDHLGCVSDNLNSLIYENKAFSDAFHIHADVDMQLGEHTIINLWTNSGKKSIIRALCSQKVVSSPNSSCFHDFARPSFHSQAHRGHPSCSYSLYLGSGLWLDKLRSQGLDQP